MNKTCQVMANITKYGSIQGYWCFCVGLGTFFAKNMAVARKWAESHGLEIVK